MDGLLTMSRTELNRLEIIQAIQDKRSTQEKAAQSQGLSVRQLKRLYRAFRKVGAAGLVSGRRDQGLEILARSRDGFLQLGQPDLARQTQALMDQTSQTGDVEPAEGGTE